MATVLLSSLDINSAEIESGTFLSCSSYITLDTGVDATSVGLQMSFYDASGNLIVAIEPKTGSSQLKTITAGNPEVYLKLENVKIPKTGITSRTDFEAENPGLGVKLPADFSTPPTAGTAPAVSFQIGIIFSGSPTGVLTLRRTMFNRGSEVSPHLPSTSSSGGSGVVYAVDVPTDTTNFNAALSSLDTNIQLSLDTLDDKYGTLPDHQVTSTFSGTPKNGDVWFDLGTVPSVDASTLQGSPKTDFVLQVEIGANGGVTPLNASGVIDTQYLPAITITDTSVVASEAAMLALTAQTGDVAVRTDISTSFILKGTNPSVLADWEQLLSPGSGVTSVGTGTGLTGGPITTTGTISLANTAVTAGSYGSASAVATFTVDAQGRLTAAGNTSIAISATQVSGLPTHTVSSTAPSTPVQDDIWFDLGTVPSVDASTLNGVADTSFLRSDVDDTVTGQVDFTGASTGFSRGINGRYSNVSGNTAFGAAIWGLDTTWLVSDSGNTYAPTSLYGMAWLRSGNANANANVGEGLYIYQNGTYQAGIGTTGMDISGNLTLTGTVDGRDVASDGLKLDGIATGANNYTHPTYSTTNLTFTNADVMSSLTTNSTGHITAMSKRTLSLTDLEGQKAVSGSGAYGYFARVDGGEYSINGNPSTGHIKITLPVLYTSHMMTFWVDVFNYRTNRSVSFKISGYNYNGSSAWINTSAVQIGDDVDNTVYFGNDGTKACVWIGDTTSTWYYPRITVRDLTIGLSTVTNSTWKTGWAVDINTTARATTDQTHSDIRVHDAHCTTTSKFAAGISVTGNITVTGTVDGRDVAADGALLDSMPTHTVSSTAPTGPVQDDIWFDLGTVPSVDADTLGGVAASGYSLSGHTHSISNITNLQTTLDGKEPAFAKNTGFNLNLGTSAGTVSEGNHTHTTADITGLPTHTVSSTAPTGPVQDDIWFDLGTTPAVNATTVTLADESVDTLTYPVFANTATGNQALKTGSNLTFNSSTGELTATILNSSARHMKRHIFEYTGSSAINIPTRTFTFKDKNICGGKEQVGYIVDEVEKVLPNAVSKNAVNYTLVHSAKIAELERIVREQQVQINYLMEKLNDSTDTRSS